MSRMGISTIVGYKGAQLFEAIGLSKEVVDKYFTGTSTRIGGLSLARTTCFQQILSSVSVCFFITEAILCLDLSKRKSTN